MDCIYGFWLNGNQTPTIGHNQSFEDKAFFTTYAAIIL